MADVRAMIATLLENAGVGDFTNPTADWAIVLGQGAPEHPDNVIVVRRLGGFPSSPKWLLDEPFVQIMVRGDPSNGAMVATKIQAVKDTLLGCDAVVVLGDRIDGINELNDILDLPPDESERIRSTYEIRLYVEPASGTNRTPL